MNAIVADNYVADFERAKAMLPGFYVPWMQELRRDAFEGFLDIGFPSTREEDWKYTNVAPIERTRFSLASPGADACSDLGCVWLKALPQTRQMVFIDGRHAPELSNLRGLPAGVTIASIAALLEDEPEDLRDVLTSPVAGHRSGFAALNTAFLVDGAYVHLAPGANLDTPLHLLFVAATRGVAAHVRNIVVAHAGSRGQIVEHHACIEDLPYLTNVATTLRVDRGASVEHHKLQEESRLAFHVAAVDARLDTDARLASSSIALGSALSRTGIDVGLDAEGASCTLDGLTLTDGRQHADHHTRIDHTQPRCTSRQFYKGVLDGASRTVFNGKVIVHAGANQTDAQQTNRNLLLSDQAEADSKPQLEIWADDVKCGHGAAIGQIDPAQIFYLQSRGIDEETARAMLVHGFAGEVLERIALPPLRQRIEQLLRLRLPHAVGVLP